MPCMGPTRDTHTPKKLITAFRAKMEESPFPIGTSVSWLILRVDHVVRREFGAEPMWLQERYGVILYMLLRNVQFLDAIDYEKLERDFSDVLWDYTAMEW